MNHPFYDYLSRLSISHASVDRYFRKTERLLMAFGRTYDNVSIDDINANINRFEPGGDLQNLVGPNDHGLTGLRHLLRFLHSHPTSNASSFPFLGYDEDAEYVRYDPSIPKEKRVPGLAARLEERYRKIIDYLFPILYSEIKEHDQTEIPCPRRIPVILKDERPHALYRINAREYILRQIDVLKRDLGVDKIVSILRDPTIEMPVLGRYLCASHPLESHIEIYYLNTFDTDFEMYLNRFEGVLCHEYAHHLHHLYLGRHFCENSATAKIIKESIADFASYLYLYDSVDYCGPRVAEQKLDGWKEYFGSGWPYAEAYWFFYFYKSLLPDLIDYHNQQAAKRKLGHVFFESTSYKKALAALHQSSF